MFEISAKQTFYFRIQSYQHLNNFKHSRSSDKANKNKNNSKTNPLSIVIESMKKRLMVTYILNINVAARSESF